LELTKQFYKERDIAVSEAAEKKKMLEELTTTVGITKTLIETHLAAKEDKKALEELTTSVGTAKKLIETHLDAEKKLTTAKSDLARVREDRAGVQTKLTKLELAMVCSHYKKTLCHLFYQH
jgi:uncharacterized protein (DUF3084 family)